MISDDKKNFAIEIGNIVIKDAGEKIGSIFGEAGSEVGKTIDDWTKWVTIKVL